MIQVGTNVKITDNTGGKTGRVFKILGGSKRRYARLGDLVVLSIKSAEPRKLVKKKDVVRAVVVRQAKEFRRKDGSLICGRTGCLAKGVARPDRRTRQVGRGSSFKCQAAC